MSASLRIVFTEDLADALPRAVGVLGFLQRIR